MIIDGRFESIKKLGDGHQATTILAKDKDTDNQVAIKVFKKAYATMSDREKRMQANEVKMYESTLHDNLITVLSYNKESIVENPQQGLKSARLPYIQMEYVCNGELFHYLYHTHGFSEVSLRIIVRQIVDGLLWLKKFNLSHNDLKPENILLDEQFIVRLADYGFARAHSTDCTEYISGTRMYTSPEINEKRPYDTEKADMFSLGVIMQLLMFRNPCFKDADQRKDKHFNDLIKGGKLRSQLEKVNVSRDQRECVLGLLSQNEQDRTSLDDLNSNPWLNNFTGECQDTQMMEFKKKRSKLSELMPNQE